MDTQLAQCGANNNHNDKRPQSPMIEKLRDIAPGETVLYYRGDFDREAVDRDGDSAGVQNYKRILRELRACAIMMRDEGKIRLDVEMVKGEARQGPFWVRKYTAVGL